MNCLLFGTLKRISLIRIAIVLWSQDRSHDLISKFPSSSSFLSVTRISYNESLSKKWAQIENQVLKVASKLSIPELLKEQLLGFMKAIGWQIFMWIIYHEIMLTTCCTRKNLSRICWTPRGTIDKKKTAEKIVRDGSLDVAQRYKLACTYCLEDYIRPLWEQLSGRSLFRKNLGMIRKKETPLVSFWSHYIEDKICELKNMIRYCSDNCDIPYEFLFKHSALSGNEEATRYFFHKLTEERRGNLARIAAKVAQKRFSSNSELTDFPKGYYTDVLCFLFRNMDEDQRTQMFKYHSNSILQCFLDWQWQNLFLEMVKFERYACAKVDYYDLLSAVTDKMRGGHADYDYRTLLRELWQQAPLSDKRYVMYRCTKGRLLLELFQVEDRKIIQLILRDAISEESEKIISSDVGKFICESLIFQDKWDLLMFFVQECLLFKDSIIKFKNEFIERMLRRRSVNTPEKKKKWDKFFQLLDDLIQSNGKKRKIEEGDSSVSKRHVRR